MGIRTTSRAPSVGDLDVADDGAVLLGEAGEVERADGVALEVGGHGDDGAAGDDAAAADAGEEAAPGADAGWG